MACAYKTKQSMDGTGIHFAIKQKICTYVHCEKDKSVTAICPFASSTYAFFHLVYGQLDAVAEVMLPKEGGFSKRFHLVFAQYTVNNDPDHPAGASKQFVKDFPPISCRLRLLSFPFATVKAPQC